MLKSLQLIVILTFIFPSHTFGAPSIYQNDKIEGLFGINFGDTAEQYKSDTLNKIMNFFSDNSYIYIKPEKPNSNFTAYSVALNKSEVIARIKAEGKLEYSKCILTADQVKMDFFKKIPIFQKTKEDEVEEDDQLFYTINIDFVKYDDSEFYTLDKSDIGGDKILLYSLKLQCASKPGSIELELIDLTLQGEELIVEGEGEVIDTENIIN